MNIVGEFDTKSHLYYFFDDININNLDLNKVKME